MARKKLTIDQFKRSALSAEEQKAVKGGYKNVPSGASNISSLIWESVDVRGNQGAGRGGDDKNIYYRTGR